MKWKEFLEQLMKDYGRLTPYDLENRTGIKQSTWHRILSGESESPRSSTINALEEAFNIKIDDSDSHNITYIKAEETTDSTIPKALKPLSEDDFVKVPVHGHVHAGDDSPIFSEDIIETLFIPKSLIPYKDLHGVVVVGDSMEPIIAAGDHAIVSLSTKPQSGDVCLVAFDDNDYVLKRVYFNKDAGFTTLVSDNKKYEPIIVPDHEIKSILPVVDLHKRRENLRLHI